MPLHTPTVRLSFPNIAKPRAGKNGAAPKYSASLILDMANLSTTEKQRLGALGQACRDKLREKFGDKAFKDDGVTPKSAYNWPFRDAGEKDDLEGYKEGDKFFNCTSHRRPGMAKAVNEGGRVSVQDTLDAETFYPGCYVQALVNPFVFEAEGNKGVALGLEHIVFIRDGERLDGTTGSAAEAYGEVNIDASELGFDEANNDGGSDDAAGSLV